MGKYLGLLSFAILAIGIVICIKLNPYVLEIDNVTFSDFGVMGKTALVFNLSLILSGIVNLFYVEHTRRKLNLEKANFISILLYIGAISIIGLGLVPTSISTVLHYVIALGLFYFYPIGFFFVGEVLASKKIETGKTIQMVCLAGILISTVTFVLIKPHMIAEAIFAGFMFVILFLLCFRVKTQN